MNRGADFPPLVCPSGLDRLKGMEYSIPNFIGQFVTILSVNKTRNRMGAMRSFFIGMVRLRPFSFLEQGL